MIGFIEINEKDASFFNKKVICEKVSNEMCKIFLKIDDHKNMNYIKYSKKLLKIINKYNIDKVVFETKLLNEYVELYNLLVQNGINVITGKYIYEKCVLDILEYFVANSQSVRFENINLCICMEQITYTRQEFIKDVAKLVHNINIYTKDVEKFTYLYNQVFDETGLSIKITNNVRNALSYCNVLINFDIDNKYIVNSGINNMLFINFSNKITKINKAMEPYCITGIDIKDIEELKEILLEKYDNLAVFEAMSILKDKMKIKALSRISEKKPLEALELKNWKSRNKR